MALRLPTTSRLQAKLSKGPRRLQYLLRLLNENWNLSGHRRQLLAFEADPQPQLRASCTRSRLPQKLRQLVVVYLLGLSNSLPKNPTRKPQFPRYLKDPLPNSYLRLQPSMRRLELQPRQPSPPRHLTIALSIRATKTIESNPTQVATICIISMRWFLLWAKARRCQPLLV